MYSELTYFVFENVIRGVNKPKHIHAYVSKGKVFWTLVLIFTFMTYSLINHNIWRANKITCRRLLIIVIYEKSQINTTHVLQSNKHCWMSVINTATKCLFLFPVYRCVRRRRCFGKIKMFARRGTNPAAWYRRKISVFIFGKTCVIHRNPSHICRKRFCIFFLVNPRFARRLA